MKFRSWVAISLVAMAPLGTGCTTPDTPNKVNFDRVMGEANTAFKKSAVVNYAWVTAEDALEKAEEAAKTGDWKSAIKHAEKAKEHSELAYAQYLSASSPEVRFPN